MRLRGTACAAQRWWIGCVLNTVISTVLFYSTLPKNVMFSTSPTSAWIVENFKVKWQVATMTKWCYENLSHLSEPRLRILARFYLRSIAKILQELTKILQDLSKMLAWPWQDHTRSCQDHTRTWQDLDTIWLNIGKTVQDLAKIIQVHNEPHMCY